MPSISQTSEPYVQYLSQIIEAMGGGSICIPRFQRPLVWKWEKRLDLLRSVRDGVPMGALMIWRTNQMDLTVIRSIGGHGLPEPAPHMPQQFLLDGLQRMSTLYTALAPVSSKSDSGDEEDDASDSDRRVVRFDLDAEEFELFDEDEANAPGLLPLNLLLDSVGLLRFQRKMGERAAKRISASDRLAKAFREYKVPVIPIVTDDIDQAARTFQLINSQGTVMSEVHMVHALTWRRDYSLRDKLDDVRQEQLAQCGWHVIDDETILTTCKAAFELDVYATPAKELSDALRKKPKRIDVVAKALVRVADFLRSRLGITSPDLVPYNLQIVLLAEAFRLRPSPTQRQEDLLVAWFWLTTYGELFAGLSGRRLKHVLDKMRSLAREGVLEWPGHRAFQRRALPKRFDFRAARAKATALRLAEVQKAVLPTRNPNGVLAEFRAGALTQGIAHSQLPSPDYGSVGNRFLLDPDHVQRFRTGLARGSLSKKLRKAHVIPDDAWEAALSGDYRRFVMLRARELESMESRHASQLASEID